MAGATCGIGVGFIAESVPGVGVVAAQAATSFKGRDAAKVWMEEGLGATEILDRLNDPDFYDGWFDPAFEDLQYGVATLVDGPDAGFVDGGNIPEWSGGVAGENFAVQGNTLRSEHVVRAAARAFRQSDDACDLTLGERLIRALEAGRDAGGDNRCPEDFPAYSAVLLVGDESRQLRIDTPMKPGLVRGIFYQVFEYAPEEGATEPIALLRQRYAEAGGQACR